MRSEDGAFRKVVELSPPDDDAVRSIVGLGSRRPDIGESLFVIVSRVAGEGNLLPEYAGKESSDLGKSVVVLIALS